MKRTVANRQNYCHENATAAVLDEFPTLIMHIFVSLAWVVLKLFGKLFGFYATKYIWFHVLQQWVCTHTNLEDKVRSIWYFIFINMMHIALNFLIKYQTQLTAVPQITCLPPERLIPFQFPSKYWKNPTTWRYDSKTFLWSNLLLPYPHPVAKSPLNRWMRTCREYDNGSTGLLK